MTGEMTGNFTQLLLGLCIGALLALAASMIRAPRKSVRWSGFLFYVTSAVFALKLWCDQTHALPPGWSLIIGPIAMSSIGWFWLMVMALFGDCDEYKPVMFLAPASLFLFALGHNLPGPFLPFIWTGSTVLQAGFAIASLVVVLRSWKGDLVESRRQVRGPFMAAVCLYMLSLNGFDIWEMLGDTPTWYPMVNAAMLTVCVLAGTLTFLEARGEVFGEADPAPVNQPEPAVRTVVPAAAVVNGHAEPNGAGSQIAIDRAAKADLERLECLMSKDEIWKEEGLTIASLALRAGIPETQLRRLINDCLGYRNFPSYVNAHRIAAAKNRLANPTEARVSISTIAYDIGFASLGPFNRAFKEEAGVSPSEWRRKALDLPSPISEEV